MNTDREAFDKAMDKIASSNGLILHGVHKSEDFVTSWEAWQAAKEDSQREIERLKADNEKLRGHLQNCANSLDGIIRRWPSESKRIGNARDSANRALTETLKN